MQEICEPSPAASKELLEATEIVRGEDHSSRTIERLVTLLRTAGEEDKPKITDLVEVFFASR